MEAGLGTASMVNHLISLTTAHLLRWSRPNLLGLLESDASQQVLPLILINTRRQQPAAEIQSSLGLEGLHSDTLTISNQFNQYFQGTSHEPLTALGSGITQRSKRYLCLQDA